MSLSILILSVFVGLLCLPIYVYVLSKAYHLGKLYAIKKTILQEIMNYGKEEKE